MAAEINEKRIKAYRLWKRHGGEIQLSLIAEKLGVPKSTVRNWKSKDKWQEKIEQERAPKKRGAKPGNKNASGAHKTEGYIGNKNALKTGAYATALIRYMTETEREAYSDDDYAEDIALALKAEISEVNSQQIRLHARLNQELRAIDEIDRKITLENDGDILAALIQSGNGLRAMINAIETAIDRATARKAQLFKILSEMGDTEEQITVTFGDFTPAMPEHEEEGEE